ncbi:transposase [Streptomyces griseorubiginosus]|nr:transposase [Streptomyces griseorubiginosus]
MTVIKVNQPGEATRRRRGKTDAIDAEAAARAVLSGRATATAKHGDGPVEALRLLRMAKTSAVKSRTQALNQLKAALVTADPGLRESLTGLSLPKLIRTCLQLPDAQADSASDTAAFTMRRLARRVGQLADEIAELQQLIARTLRHRAGRAPRRLRRGTEHRRHLAHRDGRQP